MKKIVSVLLSLLLLLQPALVQANLIAGVELPPVGERVGLSAAFQPALLRGMTIDPAHPLQFDFILDPGAGTPGDSEIKSEAQRMINYFLAALTIPQKDLWVNLSPVEKDRIVPDGLIKTEMGRDLLAQDYVLKQLAASLIYPEEGLGKDFWQRVYDEAYQKLGVTEIPVDAFNKVWIVPERASVFEKGNTVYIAQAHLKVMLEADYVAANQRAEQVGGDVPDPVNPAMANSGAQDLAKQILREVIVPAIEKEVNEGKNFARLRQVVHAIVLAQWYQEVLKASVLNKVYSGQGKVVGIDVSDPQSREQIYEQYLAAYRQGVFNYIKEEVDRVSREPMPKKYFSGGVVVDRSIPRDRATPAMAPRGDRELKVRAVVEGAEAAARPDDAPVSSEVPPVSVIYGGHPHVVTNLGLQKYLYDLQHPGGNNVVTDVSLEAFLEPIKGPAQLALGKGGLGFLTGETWGAYSGLGHWKTAGVMPLYSFDRGDKEVDWDAQEGVQPVFVQDEFGRKANLSFDVEFKGKPERVYIYWVNANGTPVFLIKHKTLFRKLYPGGDEQITQYGFFGRAYVELMKVLGVKPEVLRLSEPQLIFVVTAMKNDIEDPRNSPSIFQSTKIAMTTHTPEVAALPVWYDVGALKGLVGDDLVRGDIVYAGKVNAGGAMAHHADIINGVSPEHGDVTREAVLQNFSGKVTSIQNGSDPRLWRSDALNALIREKGIGAVTGRELFDIGMDQKRRLNEYLKDNGLGGFSDPERPLFGALRRLVEYKSQAIFIPMIRWIVGDPDKEYDSPLGRQKGLGANLLIGGEALDSVSPEWMRLFKELANEPDIKGKFVIAERPTGTEFMQLATSGCDSWLVMPWITREASGTSDQRAGFNGHVVIATATGGPLEWIKDGVNGWLINPFGFAQSERNKGDAERFNRIVWAFQNRETWALAQFYEEGRKAFARHMQEVVEMYRDPGRKKLYGFMRSSFQAAHERVSIHRMVQEYGFMFDSALRGEGVKGFEERLKAFGKQWEKEKRWQKEPAMDAAARNTGGIDARNIGVDRAGTLIQGVMDDQALEAMLSSAPGVRAVIMSVTPFSDLKVMLGLSS